MMVSLGVGKPAARAAQASEAALTTASIERKLPTASRSPALRRRVFQCHPQLRRQRRGAVCVASRRRLTKPQAWLLPARDDRLSTYAAAVTPTIAGYFAGARQRAARRAVTALCFMRIGQPLCT
jgi:hypothetical protein